MPMKPLAGSGVLIGRCRTTLWADMAHPDPAPYALEKDRQRVIDAQVPVLIGGVLFSPGDLVVADDDGVVVVPRAVEAAVLRRAWKKVHDENEVRAAIAGGMKAADAFHMYGVL